MLRTEREGPVNAASFKPIISEVKELNTRFLPSYNAGLVCNSMSHAHMLSCVQLFATPWTVAHQVPLSMGYPRQECRNGLPFPAPGALPYPAMEPTSPTLQVDSLPLSHWWIGSFFESFCKVISDCKRSLQILWWRRKTGGPRVYFSDLDSCPNSTSNT